MKSVYFMALVANCKQEDQRKFTIFLTQLCCSVDVSDVRVFVGGFLSSILIPLVASEGIKQLNVGIYIFRTNEDE